MTARNNVFAGTQYALYKVNLVILDFDWDALFTTDPTRFVRWEGIRYDDLSAFQSATGQEPSGLAAPPLLADPSNGDFSPQPGSQLVDRGLVIPGINDDFEGQAPDVGAVEYGTPLFADGFETGNNDAWNLVVP